MISTSPISSAASSAPRAAASKKPLPSDLATSAMRVWAWAGRATAIMAAAIAVVARSVLTKLMKSSLELYWLLFPRRSSSSGDRRRVLRVRPLPGIGDDEFDAAILQHLAILIADAAVRDDCGNPFERAQDQAGA